MKLKKKKNQLYQGVTLSSKGRISVYNLS